MQLFPLEAPLCPHDSVQNEGGVVITLEGTSC